jgi:hypothetical protein
MNTHVSYPKIVRDRAKIDGRGLFTLSIDDRGSSKPEIGAITVQGPVDAEEAKEVARMIIDFQKWRRARKSALASQSQAKAEGK